MSTAIEDVTEQAARAIGNESSATNPSRIVRASSLAGASPAVPRDPRLLQAEQADWATINRLYFELCEYEAAKARRLRARQQLAELKNAQNDGLPNLPNAAQRQTGNNAKNTNLADAYAAAIQNAVTPNWLRPDNMPNVPCKVHIVQLPGGDVMSATVDPSCPYDDAGRRSVENAVLRTRTLPYKGFESVFQRKLTITFTPQ